MDQDSGGKPHIAIGGMPEPEQRVDEVYVLVAITPEGGEGIYGHKISDSMYNFVTAELHMKDLLENYLREQGTIEVVRRKGMRLEWRVFHSLGQAEPIT